MNVSRPLISLSVFSILFAGFALFDGAGSSAGAFVSVSEAANVIGGGCKKNASRNAQICVCGQTISTPLLQDDSNGKKDDNNVTCGSGQCTGSVSTLGSNSCGS